MTALGLAAALPFNQTKGDPLLSLGPVFAIRAKDSVEGEQWALNRGTGGQVLRARYGSVGRAEIRRGIGAIFPGTPTNYISVPDAANLRLTQDIDIAVRYTLESLAPATWQSLACRWNGGADRSFQFAISSGGSGLLAFQRTGDGTTVDSLTSTNTLTANGLVIGNTYWFRARTSGTTLTFEWAPDSEEKPTSWTAFGGTRPLAASSFWAGTAPFWVGVNTSVTNDPLSGVVKRVVYGSYNGSTVLDINFANQPDLTTSFTCTTGQTVTVTAANAVDTNDPYLAVKKAVNYVKTFASGGYFRTKNVDGDFLNGATELDARVAFSFDAVTNASASSILISKGASTSATTSFRAYRAAATTNIRIEFSDGAAFTSAGTVAMPTYAANEIVGLRITAIMGGNVSYQWKSNLTESNALDEISSNTGWTEFGTGSIAIASLTNPGSIGVSFLGYNTSSTSNTDGKVYAGWVSDDIDGSPDIKFSTNGVSETTIYNTVTGNECFLSRASSGRLTTFIEASKFLLATDDYLEILHNQLLNIGSEFDVLAVYRDWNTASSHVIAAKGDYNSSAVYTGGWYLRKAASTADTYRFLITDGTISAQAIDSSYTQIPGELVVHAGGKYSTQTIRTKIKNNAEATYNGTPMPAFSGNTFNMFIGRLGTSASSYADIELYALYVYSRKLTDAEIAAGVQYWNAA